MTLNSLAQCHARIADAFQSEAALMRGFSWWVVASDCFDEKMTASNLVFHHMRNADTLTRLMRFLRLPETPVYSSDHIHLTRALQQNPLAGCRAVLEGLQHRAWLADLADGGDRLHDHHIAEAAAEVLHRYAVSIDPLASVAAQGSRQVSGVGGTLDT